MSKWIDADALIEAMGEEPYVWNDEPEEIAERNQWLTDMHIIENAPTIEPKRGEWIRDIHPYDKAYHLKCSACGEWGALDAEGWNWRSPFCPNCGARMKGASNGTDVD